MRGTKTVNIECYKLRGRLLEVLLRIFGKDIADALSEDLVVVGEFEKHAEKCRSCASLGREQAKAIRIRMEARQ